MAFEVNCRHIPNIYSLYRHIRSTGKLTCLDEPSHVDIWCSVNHPAGGTVLPLSERVISDRCSDFIIDINHPPETVAMHELFMGQRDMFY